MDTLEYKDLFISESLEHLDQLNQALLALEKDPQNPNALNEIFRTSHTLKGMAATMGFDQITELTHQMENILDKMRSNEQEVTTDVIDILFECLDALGLLIEEISSADPKHLDLSLLLGKLNDLEHQKHDASKPVVKKITAGQEETSQGQVVEQEVTKDHLEDLLTHAAQENYVTYGITVQVEESCTFKGVRAFMVYKALSEQGEIIASIPAPEILQEGEFGLEFILVLLSKRAKTFIERAIKNVAEIASFAVEVLSEENLEGFLEEKQADGRMLVSNAIAKEDVQPKQQAQQKNVNRILQSIRVSIERLDNLQNLVGELIINKIRLMQLSKQFDLGELKEALAQFDRITNELQDEVTEVRMVPMEHIFNRFPRMVRDLAKENGKEIELVMEGKDIELDRTVLDEIHDPLVHLLRNSIDHGIEPPDERLAMHKARVGQIRLVATREKNHVIIKVYDNGRGIDSARIKQLALERGLISRDEAERMNDQEAINLVALPGFTTATKVTEISGRGVGVDAVRTKIESFGGNLSIESEVGKGSTFILRMPMTLAIIQALLFRTKEEIYAIPVINTVETIEYNDEDIKLVQQGEVVLYRNSVLPLVRLHQLLEVPGPEHQGEGRAILITEVGDMRVGLLVDEVLGQQEIAIKSLGQMLKGIRGLSGVTILGDGRIALVLDVPSLI